MRRARPEGRPGRTPPPRGSRTRPLPQRPRPRRPSAWRSPRSGCRAAWRTCTAGRPASSTRRRTGTARAGSATASSPDRSVRRSSPGTSTPPRAPPCSTGSTNSSPATASPCGCPTAANGCSRCSAPSAPRSPRSPRATSTAPPPPRTAAHHLRRHVRHRHRALHRQPHRVRDPRARLTDRQETTMDESLVIIPTYDEAENIRPIVGALRGRRHGARAGRGRQLTRRHR